jgi:hypothetical protein
LTPRRPRLARLPRNSVQNDSASLLPTVMPNTSRRPPVLTGTRERETHKGRIRKIRARPLAERQYGPMATYNFTWLWP